MDGETITSHLPNSGSLMEYMIPGKKVYLYRNKKNKRKTEWTVFSIEKEDHPVFIHSFMTNTIVQEMLNNKMFEELKEWIVIKREYRHKKNRFDFLLKKDNMKMLLEVKSCTLWGKRIAIFPDAITERGRRHIIELSKADISGCILFIVHSPRVDYFLPNYHTDFEFSKTLYKMRRRLLIIAYGLIWANDLNILGIKRLKIPCEILKKEMKDMGSYLLILRLNESKNILVGGLGPLYFKKGYYVYVGSGMKNLSKRILRHKYQKKRLFWHIDYLREKAEYINILPVRSSERLECELAKNLSKFSDWFIKDFGSSDCPCRSHLFGFNENPLEKEDFIDLLLYYRIDRLNEIYGL